MMFLGHESSAVAPDSLAIRRAVGCSCHKYADGLREAPERIEGPEKFCWWVRERYDAGSSAASESRMLLQE